MASFVHRTGGEKFSKFFKIVVRERETSPVTATRCAKQQVRQRGDLLKASKQQKGMSTEIYKHALTIIMQLSSALFETSLGS